MKLNNMVCTPQHFLQLQLTLNAHNQRQENIQIMYAEYNGAWLFEGRLVLITRVSYFLCSKAFSQIIFSVIFRASNHQLVDKKN